jgi:anaerobic magnesium-protoporphyrin IX monomethyl ester cyclase
MKDCLIVGFHDMDFSAQVGMARVMGESAGAYRDLRLAFIERQREPLRALDVLSDVRQGRDFTGARAYHNTDLLWPVVMYLGSYLAARGHSFDYVNQFGREREALRSKLADGVRTVAITTTLYVSPAPILEIVAAVRATAPFTRIIIGGPYIANQAKTLDPQELEKHFLTLGGDIYVISQEGEAALADTITALKDGDGLQNVRNIAFRASGGFHFTEAAAEANPLHDNMVQYSLFPREELGEFVSLRTAKSCPFRCAFCSFPQRAGRYEYLSLDLVEQELDALKAIGGVTTVSFLDDSFNVPLKRFKDLLRMMIRNQYGFRWNSFLRSDHVDDEALELMAESGCEGVFLGVESGSDRILTAMNKTSRRAHYARVIPRLRDLGIITHANLIVGFPGETADTVEETRDFIEEARPDYYRAQLWYCDPTTPVWKDQAKHAIQGVGFKWSHATMSSEEACDHVDRLFLDVRNSTWLPQNGFELWSVFYLRRKGFSDAEILRFVRAFNARIKATVRGGASEAEIRALEQEIDAAALSPAAAPSLERSCSAPAALAAMAPLQASQALVGTAS